MKVSDSVKSAYKSNSITKHVSLYFPELNKEIGMDKIYFETMHLYEALLEKENIEFVGCISSKFSIQVNGLSEDIKGKKIEVKISTDGTEEEPVKLFHGIVDSAIRQSNKQIKEITAYDELYTKGNIDVASWYKGLSFPITLKNLRDSLFDYIGIKQVTISLPNDSIVIEKQYEPNTLQALSVVKAICQINGALGIINRENKFDYRILSQEIVSNVIYPSLTLFPAVGLFPTNPEIAVAAAERFAESIEAEHFSFYKKVNYEEYEVKPVDKLTIRQSENDAGITYGNGINNYIIQGNMFTYGLSQTVLETIAENIYENVKGFAYYPFTSDNNGLPFLECGVDAVSYMMIDYDATMAAESRSSEPIYKMQSFYILNRELTGIQNLRDSYSANGEEYQTEFITDLQTQIDTIKQSVKQDVEDSIKDYDFTDKFSEYTYDKEYLDEQFENMSQLNVMSVSQLPTNPNPYTIYLIQGEVFIK